MAFTQFIFGVSDAGRSADVPVVVEPSVHKPSPRQERLRREYVRRGRSGFVVVKSPEAAERPAKVGGKIS